MTTAKELSTAMVKADRFYLNGKTQRFECGCGWWEAMSFPIAVESLVGILGRLEDRHPECPKLKHAKTDGSCAEPDEEPRHFACYLCGVLTCHCYEGAGERPGECCECWDDREGFMVDGT